MITVYFPHTILPQNPTDYIIIVLSCFETVLLLITLRTYHNCNKSCKEMGGATSVMPVIRDAFSLQAADTTQWAGTIDWTVRCEWLQVASVVICSLYVVSFNF